jgi:hypothetical protein
MAREPSPAAVAARLAALRALHVPEGLEEARRRLEDERPRAREPFAGAVAARLAELRALCDLARYLHRHPRRG